MSSVHHRTTTVDGHEIFYREAGPADAPAIVLLHGYPTSSFMFRHLIPLLADRYHVIAPDHLGHLINGGHFLLESHLDVVAGYLRGFLGRVLDS